MLDIHSIASRAVGKDELRMLGFIVRELMGAAGPRFTRIKFTCAGNRFPPELDSVARDSKDKVKFLEGHRPVRARVTRERVQAHSKGTRILIV